LAFSRNSNAALDALAARDHLVDLVAPVRQRAQQVAQEMAPARLPDRAGVLLDERARRLLGRVGLAELLLAHDRLHLDARTVLDRLVALEHDLVQLERLLVVVLGELLVGLLERRLRPALGADQDGQRHAHRNDRDRRHNKSSSCRGSHGVPPRLRVPHTIRVLVLLSRNRSAGRCSMPMPDARMPPS
jgi:hypothetical protein